MAALVGDLAGFLVPLLPGGLLHGCFSCSRSLFVCVFLRMPSQTNDSLGADEPTPMMASSGMSSSNSAPISSSTMTSHHLEGSVQIQHC